MAAVWLPAAATGQAASDAIEIVRRDGSTVIARGLRGDLANGFELVDGGARALAGADVLSIHGVAARASDLPAAHLGGGEVLRGALAGGDADGERLELLSPILGLVPVPVDRLLALTTASGVEVEALRLPVGVREALFVPAELRFDVFAGTLHRFGSEGVRFQVAGASAPRWFLPREFAGLRLSASEPRRDAPGALLVTRIDDRLGVELLRCTGSQCEVRLESGATAVVRLADVASLTLQRGVVHLSDLEPVEVAESGHDGEIAWSWRRDRNALGQPLTAGGRVHGKGLGVHSNCALGFAVPPGVQHFCARVGIDDSAAELPFRAHAVARVVVDGRAVFTAELEPGQPPISTGLIPVAAGARVRLEVDSGRGGDLGDRVNWLLPVFLDGPQGR